MLNGLGQGISQSASGGYISDCANEATKGFYFSYYWAFFMGSQVFGNFIAAFVLGHMSQTYYVYLMLILGTISSIGLIFLRVPIDTNFETSP